MEEWERDYAENPGCLFWGSVGTGKSYLAGCIANALMEKEIPVIDSRYRSGKPLIVTTNLPFQELQHPKDTAYARIYDRLIQMCPPVRFTGGNFRRGKAQSKLEWMKTLSAGGKENCL